MTASKYIYGCDASDLGMNIDEQKKFVTVRMKRVEATIRKILKVESGTRDYVRLRACIKARDWCNDIMKELKE